MHFLANDPQKLNNAIKVCVINGNNLLCYVFDARR